MLIICDGGKRSGILYGSFKLLEEDATLLYHKQMVFGDGTSNQAEYLALLAALRKAKMMTKGPIFVLTDSELIKKQLSGESKCYNEKLKVLKGKIEEEIKNFESFIIIKVTRNIIKQHLKH